MNKEILILSQWLHDKGFAPDQWTGTEGHIFFTNGPGTLLIYKALEEDGEELEGTVSDNYTPYFTLDRVLELLPEKIRKEEKYYVYGCEENYFKMDFYFGINKKGIGYISDNLGIKKDNVALWESVGKGSIHLSALRLLKKTVEEGYVKAN